MTAIRKPKLKASDHSDVDRFTRALQFGSPVESRHVYLYGTLYNSDLKQ